MFLYHASFNTTGRPFSVKISFCRKQTFLPDPPFSRLPSKRSRHFSRSSGSRFSPQVVLLFLRRLRLQKMTPAYRQDKTSGSENSSVSVALSGRERCPKKTNVMSSNITLYAVFKNFSVDSSAMGNPSISMPLIHILRETISSSRHPTVAKNLVGAVPRASVRRVTPPLSDCFPDQEAGRLAALQAK